jgi:hypothetical protein
MGDVLTAEQVNEVLEQGSDELGKALISGEQSAVEVIWCLYDEDASSNDDLVMVIFDIAEMWGDSRRVYDEMTEWLLFLKDEGISEDKLRAFYWNVFTIYIKRHLGVEEIGNEVRASLESFEKTIFDRYEPNLNK